MNRLDVTEKIISTKVSKGIKWEDVAKKVGLSKEWTTAACLGQMTLDAKQAKVVGKIFDLDAEEQKWLQVVPYKGSLPTPAARDRMAAPVGHLQSPGNARSIYCVSRSAQRWSQPDVPRYARKSFINSEHTRVIRSSDRYTRYT